MKRTRFLYLYFYVTAVGNVPLPTKYSDCAIGIVHYFNLQQQILLVFNLQQQQHYLVSRGVCNNFLSINRSTSSLIHDLTIAATKQQQCGQVRAPSHPQRPLGVVRTLPMTTATVSTLDARTPDMTVYQRMN